MLQSAGCALLVNLLAIPLMRKRINELQQAVRFEAT